MKKETRKYEQEIVIINSRLFRFLEVLVFVLHILALIFGSFSIIGLVMEVEMNEMLHISEMILEFLTFFVILLIIILNILTPIIKRKFIQKFLGPFFGKNIKIKTYIKTPIVEKVTMNNFTTDIINNSGATASSVLENTELINLTWEKNGFLRYRKVLRILTYINLGTTQMELLKNNIKGIDNNLEVAIFVPNQITIDIKNRSLEFNAHLEVKVNDKFVFSNREFLFRFDSKKQKAYWSGIMPDYAYYGEWIWNNGNESKN